MPLPEDKLVIAGREFSSRLFLGSARYSDAKTLQEAIDESQTEVVTVSMRRLEMKSSFTFNASLLLPNTAGCYTAAEAVFYAHLAREALETQWIKLEVLGDARTLFPDCVELQIAAKQLVKEGFHVLAYCSDDPVMCLKLQDAGCAAIMPLGSPIGSGMGILNPYNLRQVRAAVSVPLIVDAGLGTASDAAFAMECGADAVLVNTAIAQAKNPVGMARAFRLATCGGREAYLAGRMLKKEWAEPSSPEDGKVCTAPC